MTLTVCSIEMRFEVETLPRALDLLRSAAGPTRVKRGCRSCHVGQDIMEESTVRYSEEWETEEAFRRHIRSDDFWPVLLAIDLGSQTPRVTVGNASPDQGVEILRALRRPSPGANVADSGGGTAATARHGGSAPQGEEEST